MSLEENFRRIRSEIHRAAVNAGRNPDDIRLVAVSKTKPVEMVEEAFSAGQVMFGENYVQELVAKADQLTLPVEWHFIGHLQSNKVKPIAGIVSLIHSVDRLSLAREIDRQWRQLGLVCSVLVQVNVSGESSKSGTTTADAVELIRSIAELSHIRITGLMTMPPFFADPEYSRPFFRELKQLSQSVAHLAIPGVEMRELSMGMSGDFVQAIEEGATLVRIGSALFGSR